MNKDRNHIKVYISGKVTGLDEAFELFEKAEKPILALGLNPINPMKLNHDHDKLWESYMKVCIKELCDCDIVCTLSNYTESRGAKIEVGLAKQLNIPICTMETLFDTVGKLLLKGQEAPKINEDALSQLRAFI